MGSSSRCTPTPRRPSATDRRRFWPTISPTTSPRSSAQRRSPGRVWPQRRVRVAVLGVGLIGGSIGLAARGRAGAHVCGFDPDGAALQAALELGAIDERASDVASAVAGAQVVFAAAPVGALARTVARRWPTPPRTACSATSDRPSSPGTALVKTLASSVGTHLRGPRQPALPTRARTCSRGPAGISRPQAAPTRSYMSVCTAARSSFGARPAAIAAEAHDRLMAHARISARARQRARCAGAPASLGALRAPAPAGPARASPTRSGWPARTPPSGRTSTSRTVSR